MRYLWWSDGGGPGYRCHYCQRGYTSQCGGPLGCYKYTVQMDGNMAEYFLVPAAFANLAPVPDDLADAQAVYTRLSPAGLSPAGLGSGPCAARRGSPAVRSL